MKGNKHPITTKSEKFVIKNNKKREGYRLNNILLNRYSFYYILKFIRHKGDYITLADVRCKQFSTSNWSRLKRKYFIPKGFLIKDKHPDDERIYTYKIDKEKILNYIKEEYPWNKYFEKTVQKQVLKYYHMKLYNTYMKKILHVYNKETNYDRTVAQLQLITEELLDFINTITFLISGRRDLVEPELIRRNNQETIGKNKIFIETKEGTIELNRLFRGKKDRDDKTITEIRFIAECLEPVNSFMLDRNNYFQNNLIFHKFFEGSIANIPTKGTNLEDIYETMIQNMSKEYKGYPYYEKHPMLDEYMWTQYFIAFLYTHFVKKKTEIITYRAEG